MVTPAELACLIRAGSFALQLHIGTLMLAGMRGFIELGDFGLPTTPRQSHIP